MAHAFKVNLPQCVQGETAHMCRPCPSHFLKLAEPFPHPALALMMGRKKSNLAPAPRKSIAENSTKGRTSTMLAFKCINRYFWQEVLRKTTTTLGRDDNWPFGTMKGREEKEELAVPLYPTPSWLGSGVRAGESVLPRGWREGFGRSCAENVPRKRVAETGTPECITASPKDGRRNTVPGVIPVATPRGALLGLPGWDPFSHWDYSKLFAESRRPKIGIQTSGSSHSERWHHQEAVA